MLTPHVIKDDAVYSKMSEEELRRADKLRVGVRKGMMPWGRERLAESAYEKAVEELAKANPDRKKALWHLDCATNLNPKFLEAIEMKQRLSGRVLTAVDNSAVRSFVKDMVLQDRGPASPAVVPPAGTRTGDDAKDKASNPTASKDDKKSSEEAEIDWEALPLDQAEPDSDQVVAAPKPTTAPSTTQPSPASATAKVEDKKDEKAPVATSDSKPEKKAEDKPVVTVTELPIEEVKPDAPSADENK